MPWRVLMYKFFNTFIDTKAAHKSYCVLASVAGGSGSTLATSRQLSASLWNVGNMRMTSLPFSS